MITNETTALKAAGGRGLLDYVETGIYQLPEFQRPYRWSRDSAKTCGLLTSIAQGWPAGSILLMEGTGNFQPIPVQTWGREGAEGGPGEDHEEVVPTRLILDGQQRLTALYLAYFDRDPTYHFFVHLGRLIQNGMRFEDDSDSDVFFALKENEVARNGWGDLERRARAGLLLVSEFVNSAPWERWKTIAAEDGNHDAELLTEIRDGTTEDPALSLNGLLHYEFPVTVIQEDTSDQALATIFVEINQTSTPLDTFDLATARTLRTEEPRFNLRDEWIRLSGDPHVARGDDDDDPEPPVFDFLHRFNLESEPQKKHGETPLKLLALAEVEDVSSRAWNSVSLGNGALVGLDPDYVRDRFDDAARALDSALRFLHEDEKLIPQTLPSDNYLLPIAVQFFHHPELSDASPETSAQRDKLGQWYWAVALRNHWGRGGTQGRIIDETKHLAIWLYQNTDTPPATVSGFWQEWEEVIKDELVRPKAYRKHVLKALLALDVYNGARDWIGLRSQEDREPDRFELQSTPLLDSSIELEVHHIWPKQAAIPRRGDGPEFFPNGVRVPYDDDVEKAILNRCLLLKATNAAVGSQTPNAARNHEGVQAANIDTYLLSSTHASWHDLAESRMSQIEDTVRTLIP